MRSRSTVTGTGFAPGATVQWNGSARPTTVSSSTQLVATLAAADLAQAGTFPIRAMNPTPGGGPSGVMQFTVTANPVTTVGITPDTATLVPGQMVTLVATPRDAQDNALTGRTIAYSTGTAAVATVNSTTGVVTAVSPGTAIITATVEGHSAASTITVVDGVFITPAGGTFNAASGSVVVMAPPQAVSQGTAITVAPQSAPPADPDLIPGTAFELQATGGPLSSEVSLTLGYASVPPGDDAARFAIVQWNGSAWIRLPSTVNTVSRQVTASTSTLGLFALIEGPIPVATVTIDPATVSLAPAGTAQLTATLRDASDGVLTGRTVVWASSDAGLASVSQTGLVTAIAEGGPVTITATSEGQTGTANVTVAAGIRLLGLAVGYYHTCGLTVDGAAWCWGRNDKCQLGTGICGPEQPTAVAVATALRFRQIVPGNDYTCGVTLANAVWCWGSNVDGVYGDGSTVSSATPIQTSGGHLFSSLSAGAFHICGLTTAGAAYCWGYNEDGSGGNGTTTNQHTPVPVSGGHSFQSIAAGNAYSCALDLTGAAWCWGDNPDGELGDGTTTFRTSPVEVAGGHLFESISMGEYHACGRTASNEVWCWGWNGQGQLGDGTTTDRSTPVLVSGGDVFVSINPSGWSTCGMLATGMLKCWGENAEGELADGTTTDHVTPMMINSTDAFVSLTSGIGYHFCGIRTDGALLCWGWNNHGQIGDGTYVDRMTPTLIPPPTAPAGLRSGPQATNSAPPASAAKRKHKN